MIDKVILYDIKCGKKYISTLQTRQILGRAGRTYNKFQQGSTYIFGLQNQKDKINQYYYGDDNTVNSNLNDIDKISFHILPEIASNKVKSKYDIQKWFENTLSFHQGNKIDIDKIYQYLIQNNCIDQNFNLLSIGILSIKYYYSPKRINILSQKMKYLNNLQDFSIMSLSWMFSYYSGSKVFHPLYLQFEQMITSKYYLHLNQIFDFFTYFLILNNKNIKKIASYIGKTRKDLFRLLALTQKIAQFNKINLDKQLKLIETMLYYGVSIDGAQLMLDIDCYEINIIRKLLQIQIHNYKQLQYNIDFIKSFYDEKTFNICNKIVQERTNNVLLDLQKK